MGVEREGGQGGEKSDAARIGDGSRWKNGRSGCVFEIDGINKFDGGIHCGEDTELKRFNKEAIAAYEGRE
jgi:hypothetical protein